MAGDKTQLQNQNLPPVCRVHVYSSTYDLKRVKLPLSWCGPVRTRGDEMPDAIIGQDACVLKDPGGARLPSPRPSPWAVLDCRVNRTRQWNCSSTIFHVASPLETGKPIPRPPVRPNDVIVIEMGYTASYLTKVSHPDGSTDYTRFQGDVVFYGIVDTVKERDGQGANDGVVWAIQARCPMRFLADNKMRANYMPAGIGQNGVNTGTNRATVIRDLIYIGSLIDYVEWEDQGLPPGGRATVAQARGVADILEMRQPKRDGQGNILVKTGKFSENSYLKLGLIEYSTRADVLSPEIADAQQGVRIMDKFPLDVIKHFSLVESAPRELWADERSGKINWMARRTDMIRLGNPATAASRQYFYRFPSDRANIMSATNEWSTLGAITHFILTNPLTTTSGATDHKDLYAESPTVYSRDPHTGLPLRPMTRNRFLYDDTLTSEDAPAAIVGAMIEIYGRALMTGMVMTAGDPTLTIGEAVQIHNTGLFGRLTYGNAATVATGQPVVVDGVDYGLQQDGVFRVEAVQQLFAVGGPSRGYTTVFVYGPADPDTGVLYTVSQDKDSEQYKKNLEKAQSHPLGARVIHDEAEWKRLRTEGCLQQGDLEGNHAIISPFNAADAAEAKAEAERTVANKNYDKGGNP
jgi:hypothetical protein